MKSSDIVRLRLHHQQISSTAFTKPSEIVSWLLAMQAQDYSGAKWSIALRLPGCTEADIDTAIKERSIIRTWPMRGTLHFLAAEDARWMVRLLAPRIIVKSKGRYRQLELSDDDFLKSRDILFEEMEGGKALMRSEIYSALDQKGISTNGERGINIIGNLAMQGVLCHGPHHEKQPTYVLMDEWIPKSRDLDQDEAMTELTLRYFGSHGPASLPDFMWWTGLNLTEARNALEAASGSLSRISLNGTDYWMRETDKNGGKSNQASLLPGFDELMLGYTDRSLIVNAMHADKIVPGKNGLFLPTLLINGKVKGIWKRSIVKDRVLIEASEFETISEAREKLLEIAARKYGKYLKKKVEWKWV